MERYLSGLKSWKRRNAVYNYKAEVLDVYDADTMTLRVDLGMNVFVKEKVRLFGIDTPELRTKDLDEKRAGYEARDYVRNIILGKVITIKTHKNDKKGKFGRYLVEVMIGSDNLNQLLIDNKHAIAYFGDKKIPWSEWFNNEV